MIDNIQRGWYTYTVNGVELLKIKENYSSPRVCKTCKLNNFNKSIICLDCKRARKHMQANILTTYNLP